MAITAGEGMIKPDSKYRPSLSIGSQPVAIASRVPSRQVRSSCHDEDQSALEVADYGVVRVILPVEKLLLGLLVQPHEFTFNRFQKIGVHHQTIVHRFRSYHQSIAVM